MPKTIFAIKPLGKTMQGGKALYGLELMISENQHTKQIWKSIDQYYLLQKQIGTIAFDFDKHLQNDLNKSSDEQKMKLLVDFVNQCKCRPDITNLLSFREFFQLDQADFQYLDQWTRVNVDIQGMVVADLAYDPKNQLLITLHKSKNKVQKVTNFLKGLLSKQTKTGYIKVFKKVQNWDQVAQIQTEAEPQKIQWHMKSGMLFVSTQIGIYTYIISSEGNKVKYQLIDFVKIYDLKCFKYAPKSGNIYYASPQKLYFHSINDQFSVQLNTNPFKNISCFAIDKAVTRLYCSVEQKIKIFDISQQKSAKQIFQVQNVGKFNHLQVSQKYLFGISTLGYVTVFQIKPPGKQRLTCTLTNLDCPANTSFFAFNEHSQMIITTNKQYIVLVSTKNIPLFAGGAHSHEITTGKFNNEGNLIITADSSGWVIFYNLSFRNSVE